MLSIKRTNSSQRLGALGGWLAILPAAVWVFTGNKSEIAGIVHYYCDKAYGNILAANIVT